MNVRRCISYCSNGEFSNLSIVSFQGFFFRIPKKVTPMNLEFVLIGVCLKIPPVKGEISGAQRFPVIFARMFQTVQPNGG